MKASELRSMTREELEHELEELREEEFRLRLRRPTEELPNALRLRTIGREIARILTVLREDKRGIIQLPTKSSRESAKPAETATGTKPQAEKREGGTVPDKKKAPVEKKPQAKKTTAKKAGGKNPAPKKKTTKAVKAKTGTKKADRTKESGK